MSRIKYVESNVPKNAKLRVQYLDAHHVKGLPHGVKRVTVAQIVDDKGNHSVACSSCRPEDNDNRKIGRAIAVGRCLKEYFTRVAV